MIRYPLNGESMFEAVVHAGMMAHVAAQFGDPNPGYVITCAECGEPISGHGQSRSFGKQGCPIPPSMWPGK